MGDHTKANRRERAPAAVDVYRQRNKFVLFCRHFLYKRANFLRTSDASYYDYISTVILSRDTWMEVVF
uniref:Uncharacterized protein n=1 Tax=Ascaris lumbricoides TaxID=6252 RepID=A0A0M3HJG2_ASCLU